MRPPGLRQRAAGLARTGQRLIYHLPKSRADGQTALYLTPLEFLERLAALIPPPRKHRHRYHGVLAPNSPLRPAVTAYAGLPLETPASQPASPIPPVPPAAATAKTPIAPHARYLWAVLIARIYEILPLICPKWGDFLGEALSPSEARNGRLRSLPR